MPLHAKEFFAELNLPFATSTVIGDRYYAALADGSALRLRIDFAPTIRHGEYDGLRLNVIHPERGALHVETLAFADHHTFTHREAARGKSPGHDGYARIRDWQSSGPAPWRGADLTGLRQAVTDFTAMWTHPPTAPSTGHQRERASKAQTLDAPGLQHPAGFWAADTDFLDLLHQATLLVFDFAEYGTLDGIPVSQNLRYAREGVRDTLGLPTEYGLLAEAEAVAHITQTAGRPYGPGTAAALACIDAVSLEDQHALVKAAAHRYRASQAQPVLTTAPTARPALPASAPAQAALGRTP
ncbi:hypothetical protein K7B10_07680 [Streptomyces flavotricini]|uniref:Transposase n=1 Tax=Streptomyces flavotricini TaxID=66888 RepID=A0ABS8E2Y8_9ACTN|nr:hypothetical protein [Streptomyces flavotricini]MCC0094664.1 hypothetical protein [Streptomyces flavotricini]